MIFGVSWCVNGSVRNSGAREMNENSNNLISQFYSENLQLGLRLARLENNTGLIIVYLRKEIKQCCNV